MTTGVRSRLELFGEQTRQEAGTHVEEVDGFCRHLDEVASEGEPFTWIVVKTLMTVSRKAATTAEAQSTELAGMSSTISTTLTELKNRSAKTAESAGVLSSSIMNAVSSFSASGAS